MTDDLPATPDVTTDAPATPDAGPLLTAQEAATILGVSERTVRRRIGAGELPAAKVAGQYRIPAGAVGHVPLGRAGRAGHPAGQPATAPDAAGHAGQDAGHAGRPVVGADLQPLAELIGDLTRENRQLAEAAAVWQVRALRAEERLKALGAGDGPAQDAPQAPPAAPGTTAPAGQGSEAAPWWRRVWWPRDRERD